MKTVLMDVDFFLARTVFDVPIWPLFIVKRFRPISGGMFPNSETDPSVCLSNSISLSQSNPWDSYRTQERNRGIKGIVKTKSIVRYNVKMSLFRQQYVNGCGILVTRDFLIRHQFLLHVTQVRPTSGGTLFPTQHKKAKSLKPAYHWCTIKQIEWLS